MAANRETFEEMDARIAAEVKRDEIEEGIRCDCGVKRGVSHFCSALVDHCWIGSDERQNPRGANGR